MPATRPPVKRMAFCRTNRFVLRWTRRSRRRKVAPVCTVPRILLEASKCPGVDNSQRMPDSPKPIVSALIVSHNTKDLLLQCMHALFASADGPRLLMADGTVDPAARRAFPVPSALFYRTIGLSRLFPKSPRFGRYNMGHLDESDVHEVDAGSADCLMLRRAALDRVGFFDPRYFMYGEDIDLCYRLKLGGWKVFYLPTATAIHHERAAPDEGEKRQMLYEEHRAMWTYHFKHHAEEQSAFGNGLVWAQIWGRWAARSLRQSVSRERRTTS